MADKGAPRRPATKDRGESADVVGSAYSLNDDLDQKVTTTTPSSKNSTREFLENMKARRMAREAAAEAQSRDLDLISDKLGSIGVGSDDDDEDDDPRDKQRSLKTEGVGSSKKEAKTRSAWNMLKLLTERLPHNHYHEVEDIQRRMKKLESNQAGVQTAVSHLFEYCQQNGRLAPRFEEGPALGTNFTTYCFVDGIFKGPHPAAD